MARAPDARKPRAHDYDVEVFPVKTQESWALPLYFWCLFVAYGKTETHPV
jgi:hypothetical protein